MLVIAASILIGLCFFYYFQKKREQDKAAKADRRERLYEEMLARLRRNKIRNDEVSDTTDAQ